MSDDLEEFANTVGNAPKRPRDDEFVECDSPAIVSSTRSDDQEQNDARMWASSGENFYPCEKTVDLLPAGQYLVRYCDSRGFYFSRKKVNLDDLINLPDNNSDTVLHAINDFWGKEQAFRDLGFLWKRGILLWGPPGSGKTSTVQQLSKQIVEKGGISIYCTYPGHDAEGLRILRRIEPRRPLIVILEDIDAIIQRHGEAELLAMLDGELQVDNVVFVATTNYPERLDKRFVNRPSRFDEIIKIGMPNAECRKVFLEIKNKRLAEDPVELQKWVDGTEGFSVAHLRELIVSVECLGNTAEDTMARLRKMIDVKLSSDDNERKIGLKHK